MTDQIDFISAVFSNQGRASHRPCDQCPPDDDLTGFFDRVLSATETRAIEDHALLCAYSHELQSTDGDRSKCEKRKWDAARVFPVGCAPLSDIIRSDACGPSTWAAMVGTTVSSLSR